MNSGITTRTHEMARFSTLSVKAVLPPGEYYVGDLSQVLSNDWPEMCDLIAADLKNPEGMFTLRDGRMFAVLYTHCGDGVYADSKGNRYSVSAMSRLIGAIKVTDITIEDREYLFMGNIHAFEYPAALYREGGILHFGPVSIDTANPISRLEDLS